MTFEVYRASDGTEWGMWEAGPNSAAHRHDFELGRPGRLVALVSAATWDEAKAIYDEVMSLLDDLDDHSRE